MEPNTIRIDDVEYVRKNSVVQFAATEQSHPYQLGKNYFVRTVTMIQIGRLVGVTEHELVLAEAVWVADTGRFTTAMLNGKLDEVELFPKNEHVIVGRGAIVDAVVWPHELPKEQI